MERRARRARARTTVDLPVPDVQVTTAPVTLQPRPSRWSDIALPVGTRAPDRHRTSSRRCSCGHRQGRRRPAHRRDGRGRRAPSGRTSGTSGPEMHARGQLARAPATRACSSPATAARPEALAPMAAEPRRARARSWPATTTAISRACSPPRCSSAYDRWLPAGRRRDTLGARSTRRGLALTRRRATRALVLTGNAWGFLLRGRRRPARRAPARAIGARPPSLKLAELLDDDAPHLLRGQPGSDARRPSCGYRVKDAAAYYIGELHGHARSAFHDDIVRARRRDRPPEGVRSMLTSTSSSARSSAAACSRTPR